MYDLIKILKPLLDNDKCIIPIELVLYIENIIRRHYKHKKLKKAQKKLAKSFIRYEVKKDKLYHTLDYKVHINNLGTIFLIKHNYTKKELEDIINQKRYSRSESTYWRFLYAKLSSDNNIKLIQI